MEGNCRLIRIPVVHIRASRQQISQVPTQVLLGQSRQLVALRTTLRRGEEQVARKTQHVIREIGLFPVSDLAPMVPLVVNRPAVQELAVSVVSPSLGSLFAPLEGPFIWSAFNAM